MRIKTQVRVKVLLLAILANLCLAGVVQAQTIWEDSRSLIYPYLTRMADKGLITLQDVVLPITHTQINEALKTLLTVEPETTQPAEAVEPEVDLTELGAEINNFIKSIKK